MVTCWKYFGAIVLKLALLRSPVIIKAASMYTIMHLWFLLCPQLHPSLFLYLSLCPLSLVFLAPSVLGHVEVWMFFLYTRGPPLLPLPPSLSLSLSSLAVRVHQEGVCLRETYRKKKPGRLLFSDWDNHRFSCPLCCACQQVQCLPHHNSRWAAGGDALLFCSLSSCCPWLPGLGMPPSTSHQNVSTGFHSMCMCMVSVFCIDFCSIIMFAIVYCYG